MQQLGKICLLFIDHPNCRSCIIPVVEEFKPTARQDEKQVFYKEYNGNELTENQKEWFNSLTKKEKSDLNEYTTSIYREINTGLRKGTIEGYNKSLANSISGALQRNKFDIDLQVYRGSSASIFKNILDSNTFELMKNRKIDAEILKDKLIGNTINDKGFMSTTCDSNMMGFLEGVLFKIDIDRGMNGLGYIAPLSDFKEEEEVLLDKNTSLYIKDVSFNKEMNSYIISCKYLGQIQEK